MIVLLALLACAPEPASIVFDGGGSAVTVHDGYSIPVRHATVLDKDGKAFDPQPHVRWDVDNTDVVTLDDETLTPRNDGVAKVEASVGEVRASYTLTVELNGKASAETRLSPPHESCPVTNFGSGVYVFGCDAKRFPGALAEYLGTHRLVVTSVSPLVENGGRYTTANSYLVITRPNE